MAADAPLSFVVYPIKSAKYATQARNEREIDGLQ